MLHFVEINWIELNQTFQTFIIDKLLMSFNKKKVEIDSIMERFTKRSCIVNLYYEDFVLKGICISWYCNKYLYLDKFFVFSGKKGIGSLMLDEYINKYSHKNKMLWRTDTSTPRFYLKHKEVIKHFENGEKKIYLGNNKISWGFWEYEDIYDLNIKSCFK